jgi:hypothetical protein
MKETYNIQVSVNTIFFPTSLIPEGELCHVTTVRHKLRLTVNWIAVSALGFTAKRKEKE